MTLLNESYTLNNGASIPKLGLGTWMIANDDAEAAVKDAVSVGYRHIDTAQAYQNEQGVAAGVKSCGVARHELFITSKLAAEVKSYNEAVSAIDGSLQLMNLDYLDLMIIHSPKPWREFHGDDAYLEGNLEAWRALEQALQAGKLRAIGLSNFEIADVENILQGGSVKPQINQILAHISNTPAELIDYCQSKDIVVEAYSPIAHGELLKNRTVIDMAKRYDVSVPQLSIRYCLQLGMVPLPKTSKVAHMKANAAVDFTINEEDMTALKTIERIKDYGEASMMPVFGGQLP